MVKKLPQALALQQKYSVKESERVIFMPEDRGSLHTPLSVGVEDRAWWSRHGSPGGCCGELQGDPARLPLPAL